MARHEMNHRAVFYFAIGVIVGVMACFILTKFPPGGLTRGQMLHNVCPTIKGGTHWCAGRSI